MTKFEVTLAQLRKHGACFDGYNKVIRSLQGKPFTDNDHARESYIRIRYAHKEPIPLLDILESNGLDDALWCLRCGQWDRDSRLFAGWCARQVQHLMADERSLNALSVAEKFARDAAGGAARLITFFHMLCEGAARDAARDAQKEMFTLMCKGQAPWQK